jgi:uncharacterized protein with HEPN domain
MRLEDILEACETIRQYTPASKEAFDADPPVRSHILFHIQVIGEAASNLSESLREQHPEVPWKAIVRMRNIIAHVYFGIDWNEVWRVATADIAVLRAQVQAILDALPPDEDAPE